MYQILEDNFYLENNFCTDKYLIQMQSQAKSSGIKLLEVHGMRKNLDPNLRLKNSIPYPNREVWKGHVYVREEPDQKGKDLITSIMQSTNHLTCHRKFLEEQKSKQEKQTMCIPQIQHIP